MWSTPSLPSFPDPLWPGVVAPDRDLSMGQIELFDYLNYVQTNVLFQIELWEIEPFHHFTVYKQITDV